MLAKSVVLSDIRKRSLTLIIQAVIFFALCYSANWWDYIVGWHLILMLCTAILFFWMFCQLIFEIAVLVRDRKVLTKYHFIPFTLVALYWIILIYCFLLIFDFQPLGEDNTML